MEISPEEFSRLVEMEVNKQLNSLSEWARLSGRVGGRIGGRAKNPNKGFGFGDNARKAVLARWAKYRAAKQGV